MLVSEIYDNLEYVNMAFKSPEQILVGLNAAMVYAIRPESEVVKGKYRLEYAEFSVSFSPHKIKGVSLTNVDYATEINLYEAALKRFYSELIS